jgi:hypothetical protein
MYSRADVGVCFTGISSEQVIKIGISGESLGRELLAGLYQLLDPSPSSLDGRKFKAGPNEKLTELPGGKRLQLLWNPDGKARADAHVYVTQFNVIGNLAQLPTLTEAELQTHIALQCRVFRGLHRDLSSTDTILIYMANPAPSRERQLFDWPGMYGKTTRTNVNRVVEALKKVCQELNIPVVDAYITTEPRWYASHDGIHYTNGLCGTNSAKGMRLEWQGGVSHYTPMMLLNLMCNQPSLVHQQLTKRGG